MLIQALFIIPKKWKPPRCPSTDKQSKLAYSYNGILFHNKKE